MWAAIESITPKFGCVPQALNDWVKRDEVNTGTRVGFTTTDLQHLAEAGIEPSVGSKGDSCDNALAETIKGLYEAELSHRRAPWKTKESMELASLERVSWFNHHRLLEPIGYISPAEAAVNHRRHFANQAATAA